MNACYSIDMETGRAYYARRRQQPAGLAAALQRKKDAEAAALAPYSVEKDYYDWIVKRNGLTVPATFKTKKEAVAWALDRKAWEAARK